MDSSFVRNQIELKLEELQFLLNQYSAKVDQDFAVFNKYVSDKQKSQYKKLILELEEFGTDIENIKDVFTITYAQLSSCYVEYNEVLKSAIANERKSMTSTYEGISIEREKLQFSGLATSVGYNSEHKIMDMEYSSGGVYRYYEVPQDYYETVKNRSSFRGLKQELAVYKVVKIEG